MKSVPKTWSPVVLVLSVVTHVIPKHRVKAGESVRRAKPGGAEGNDCGADSFVCKKDVSMRRWEELPPRLMSKRTPPILS